jgi:hypothetical protein
VVVSDLKLFSIMMLVGASIGLISWFGRRQNVSEARFDTTPESEKLDV